MTRKNIQESSLNRIREHIGNYDYAFISAERYARDCNSGERYTNKENSQLTRSLYGKLLHANYGVTNLKGSWVNSFGLPDEKETTEISFLVVDRKGLGALRADIIRLGKEFNQNAIMFG